MMQNMYDKDLSSDYKDKCGNCHETLMDGDKYCRHCGTKRGEGQFKPYLNIMECIYGPMPVKRKHICNTCKTIWERELMIDQEHFCPNCGGNVDIIETPYWDNEERNEETITLTSDVLSISFSSNKQTIINIGRTSTLDFPIPHPSVSRKHASIIYQNNQWYLQDLGSTNGTMLNGIRIYPFKGTPLSNGDQICFAGLVTITVLTLTSTF